VAKKRFFNRVTECLRPGHYWWSWLFQDSRPAWGLARCRISLSDGIEPHLFRDLGHRWGPAPSIVPGRVGVPGRCWRACRAHAAVQAEPIPSRRPPALAGWCGGHGFLRSHGPAEHRVKGQWLTNRYGHGPSRWSSPIKAPRPTGRERICAPIASLRKFLSSATLSNSSSGSVGRCEHSGAPR
jgi:hypothetical protein